MGGWWMMILMALLWLLLIAGIVLIIVWVVNRTRGLVAAGGESPLDIIKRRYARGEIDREEYERMRQELS
jgi:putative membrane protein